MARVTYSGAVRRLLLALCKIFMRNNDYVNSNMGHILPFPRYCEENSRNRRFYPHKCRLAASVGLVPWELPYTTVKNVATYVHLYRAMLCMLRTMLSQVVYLSVCLSVTHRYSVETAERIPDFFSHRVVTPY